MLSTESPYHLRSIAKSHKGNKHARTEQLTASLLDSKKNASLDCSRRARVEIFAFRSLDDKKFMKLDAQRRNTLSPSIDKKESHTGVTCQYTENKHTSTEQLTPAS
jgi:hypothetical protein